MNNVKKLTASETSYELLRVLSDGEFHSGESLGESLGITRAAIWKQLKKLEDWGLAVESNRGVGYKLKSSIDLLSADEVVRHLTTQDFLSTLEVFPSIDSTNKYLLERVHNPDFSGSVVSAEMQTSGRGRRGRVWESPFASNLYLSIGWTTNEGIASLEGLSLAIGVGIAEAVESLGIAGNQLKWPNDILNQNRKLAGVLIEIGGDLAGDCNFVVGIGLNVQMQQLDGEKIDQPWTDLSTLAKEQSITLPGRNRVLSILLNHLLPIIANYSHTGLQPYIDRWQQRNWTANQAVTISGGASSVSGVNLGITESGALQLIVDGDVRNFNGGELSLRVKDGSIIN
ncbi:bifunctional biotin--[acetyl-CoA-carboxylase] ligase/biotin operon repressor BirA [Sessilibacter corallicola]|uniref:Bifunctional ligase/repressor BirA n=1 Tax=Sessilibacter corallicola TaxID=2904075 RepID=A0ABQ0AAL5_9GAMM